MFMNSLKGYAPPQLVIEQAKVNNVNACFIDLALISENGIKSPKNKGADLSLILILTE